MVVYETLHNWGHSRFMYSEITQEIKISVDTTFVEEQSEPDDFHFVWAYHIRIENGGGDCPATPPALAYYGLPGPGSRGPRRRRGWRATSPGTGRVL